MALDERQKVITKTFTREQLKNMSVEDLATLVGKAGPGATFRGTAIVRRADGSIKCDEGVDPSQFEGM